MLDHREGPEFGQYCDTEAFLEESGERSVDAHAEASESFHEQESDVECIIRDSEFGADRGKKDVLVEDKRVLIGDFSPQQEYAIDSLLNDHAVEMNAALSHEFSRVKEAGFNLIQAIKNHLSFARIGRLKVDQSNEHKQLLNKIGEQHLTEHCDTEEFLADNPEEATIDDLEWASRDFHALMELQEAELEHDESLERGDVDDAEPLDPKGDRDNWFHESGAAMLSKASQADREINDTRQFLANEGNPMTFFPSITQHAEVSQSFYDRLAETRAQKEAQALDASDRDFGLDR